MKKLLAFLTILSFFLFSCSSKGDMVEDLSYGVFNTKFESFKKLVTNEQRKVVFSMMSPAEKAALWKSNIEQIAYVHEFNEKQKDLIQEATNFLNADFFENEVNAANNKNYTIWKYKAATSFSKEELSMLFTSFGYLSQNKFYSNSNTVENEALMLKSCSCSIEEDFCLKVDIGFDDDDGDGDAGDGEDGGYECRSSNSCEITATGCGWFWLSSCNGKCIKKYI